MNINIGIDKDINSESLYITPHDKKTPKDDSFPFIVDSVFNKDIKRDDDNLQRSLKKNKVNYDTTNSTFEINKIIELGNKEMSKIAEEINHKGLISNTDSSALEFNHIKPIINDKSSALLENSIQKNDEISQKQDLFFNDISKYGEKDARGEKNAINDESSALLENSIQKNDEISQKQDLFFNDTTTTKREISLLGKNNNKVDNFSELQHQEIYDNTLIITKQNDNSIKLVLEPDGIGELNIEISQKEGSINAQFNVVNTIGKELLEKNLNDILYSLTEGGVSIGNFSISLKDRRYRDKIKKDISDGNTREERITENINRVILHKNDGNLSIFV